MVELEKMEIKMDFPQDLSKLKEEAKAMLVDIQVVVVVVELPMEEEKELDQDMAAEVVQV